MLIFREVVLVPRMQSVPFQDTRQGKADLLHLKEK